MAEKSETYDQYHPEVKQLTEIRCQSTVYDANNLLADCGGPVTHLTPKGTPLCGKCAVRWTQDEYQRAEDHRRARERSLVERKKP